MECLSRWIYPACSSAIPNKLIKSIDQIHLNVIWINKPHDMKESDMIKDIKDGGREVTHFALRQLKKWIGWNRGSNKATHLGAGFQMSCSIRLEDWIVFLRQISMLINYLDHYQSSTNKFYDIGKCIISLPTPLWFGTTDMYYTELNLDFIRIGMRGILGL